MRVWLIKIGEPLPIDHNNPRLLRTGILAKTLIDMGHEVLWWTSTYNHTKKTYRYNQDTLIHINNSFSMYLLHSIAYKKNISPARIINHFHIAQKFKKLSLSLEKPDIIICSFPTVELCYQAAIYSKKNNIPFLIDIRDLWPDIFLDLFPKFLHPLCRLIFKPMYNMVDYSCKKATGIMGNAPYFVEWGLNFAKRTSKIFDKCFPFGYFSSQPSDTQIEEARLFWNQLNLNTNSKEMIICFFGNLGHYSELDLVIQVAKILEEQGKQIKFVLCGSGDKLEKYKEKAKNSHNIIFPGWVNASKIWVLMRMSSLGLVPYKRNSFAYTNNLPNKVIEYFSAGLPVISSLKGYLEQLMLEKECGVTYCDTHSFISTIENLYNDSEKLKTMSNNAYRLYLQQFVGETVYQDMVKHIEKTVSLFQSNSIAKPKDMNNDIFHLSKLIN